MTTTVPIPLLALGAAGVAPFGPPGATPLRRTPEPVILAYLILGGFIHDFRSGDGAACVSQAREALDRWCEMGLGFARGPDDGRLFDPVEVANFIPWSGLFADDPFWQEHFVTTGRRLTQEFRGSPDAAPGDGASAPHDFHLRLTRRFGPAAGLAGKRARLFLRYPVEGGASLLLAPPRVSAPDGARIRTGTDRLEVMLTADAGLIEVAADYQIRCAPAALGHVAALPVAERALYLQPREGLIQITPRIAALAEALGGPERNPLELAEGFRDFIHGTLICGVLRYDLIPHDSPLDWVLQHRWFDCQLGSALLAALCRARNVPARLCAGHLLYRHAPTFHYWVEIWCPDTGWRGFDLLSWTLSVAGRDADWRGIFSGTLDPRLQTETLPRHFTGMGSASLPARWHLLLTPHADGAETRICERETGTLAVSDRLSFRPPAPA